MKTIYSINKNCTNLTKSCNIEHYRTFQIQDTKIFYTIECSDHIIRFSKFFQPPPCSDFIPAMSPLPIILIVNLNTKSNLIAVN